jgi:hypothetical protein
MLTFLLGMGKRGLARDETAGAMRSVTKWLAGRVPAPAQRHGIFATQIERISQVVLKHDRAGHKQRAVLTGFDNDGGHQVIPFRVETSISGKQNKDRPKEKPLRL